MFQEADLAHWLKTIALREGYTVDELEYNFVDADTLFTLNKEYLNHDTDTDIITFDYSEIYLALMFSTRSGFPSFKIIPGSV